MDDDGNRSLEEILLESDIPYEELDISELPQWWQDAITEFENHNLKPYKPPRFEDDVLKFRVIDRLEQDFGVNIDFIGKDVSPGDKWEVRVDGESIGVVAHRRSTEGYSVFEIGSDAFTKMVTSHLV